MLNVLSKEEAVAVVRAAAGEISLPTEPTELSDSAGRTLSRDIAAKEDVPAFDRSTVDGYAVRAFDTFGAGNAIPAQLRVCGEIAMGKAPDLSVRPGECVRIPTGGMLPEGTDAAVMVEHTDESHGLCLIYRPVSPGANVTKKGEDIRLGQTVLRKGTQISAAQVGVLAALGELQVPVFRRPVVSVISTGDELTDGPLAPGKIRDVNGSLLCEAVRAAGGEALFYGAFPDDRQKITDALRRCLDRSDIVLISGGSSAGTRDMTVDILGELGSVSFHGVAMKPGKPTIFGTVGGKAVFGLPGHPLAAYFVFRLIVLEHIDALLQRTPDRKLRDARLAENIPSNHGREEYLCVRFCDEDTVVPLHTRSGAISVLAEADGFIRIDRDAEGLEQGMKVTVYRI